MNTLSYVTEEILPTFSLDTADLRDVLKAIEAGARSVAFATDARSTLAGVMTDGDVRRALLAGASLDDQAAEFVTRTPHVVNERESRTAVLDFMRARVINQIPVVDDAGRLVGLHTLQGLLGRQPRPNLAFILAGGRGTRLHPLTEDLPKVMVPIAGRPVLERIITHLVGYGISEIVLAVGHMAERIVDHFGDGTTFGCRIRYVAEDPDTPLGTAGSLGLLVDLVGELTHPILVMNGDLLTTVDVGALLARHETHRPAMTIATKSLPFQVPYAVIDQEDGRAIGIVEKPVFEHTVNIGVYVLSPDSLDLVPVGARYDMTDFASDLLASSRQVLTWQSDDDWIDIGSPTDLGRARGAGA